ncbi:hypothetical protein BAUCODRAFT_64340 [Baudoinia panamericana UAMH 10762]|uniref:Peptidase S54 rhomboid domain-containing protein n=1 Tax=Baudoinia panamericana (strain UAMH 10762) TaxID=717646 RepID=M2NL99_BAUPA|nr:uncharacterized protein BAUCODRAFT_64340 [Baudoinia panamericana UAMH 10762]EMD00255.1 hypothetical protein BAUCODRAFT_64340 [Baudoinia panamericana UAMH 10762]
MSLSSIQSKRQSYSLRRPYSNITGRDSSDTYTSAENVIWTLISLNIAVFGTWQYARYTQNSKLIKQLKENATLSLANFEAGRYWTLLTAAFSHTEWWHILFNMMSLRAFGSILSFFPGVGGGHILALSVGSALAGSGGWLYQQKAREDLLKITGAGGQIFGPGTHASGAVLGMGAAATCLMPFAPINILFIPVAIPLWVATVGYAALDTYLLGSKTSHIGHAAHLSGSLFGLLYYFTNMRGFGGVWWMLRRRWR